MEKMKAAAYMAMGAAGMMAFQKYKEPVAKAAKKMFNKEMNMVNKTLEDLM